MSREKPVKGGAWEIGAISNASWTGVKLRDVLIYLGVDPDSTTLQHVQVLILLFNVLYLMNCNCSLKVWIEILRRHMQRLFLLKRLSVKRYVISECVHVLKDI
jgi:hypothetical protein